MRVLHVLASRSRSWGGPPMMVANLSRSLAQLGIDSVILALDRKSSPNVEFADGVIVRSCGVAAISRMGIPANSRKRIITLIKNSSKPSLLEGMAS